MDMSTNLIIAVALFAVLVFVLWFFSYRAKKGENESVEGLREAAERGDVYSQFRLGQMYYEGRGVARNDSEAAKWFAKAATQEHAEAQYILASMVEKGAGVKKSDEDAFRLYLQAATQGHERASVILEAEKWTPYKKKHLSGNEMIHTEVVRHHDPEEEVHEIRREHPQEAVSPDASEQLHKYLVKAQAGDVDAQYNLGIMYYHGEGAEKDHEQALKWFHLAAEQNDPEAQYNLGFMYGRGEGAAKDHHMSREWFQKAASQGHAGAREILGKMFK